MILWTIQWVIISALLIGLMHYLYSFFENILSVPQSKDLVNKNTIRYNDNSNNLIIKNDDSQPSDTTLITTPDTTIIESNALITNNTIINNAINSNAINSNAINSNAINSNNSMEMELKQYLQSINTVKQPIQTPISAPLLYS